MDLKQFTRAMATLVNGSRRQFTMSPEQRERQRQQRENSGYARLRRSGGMHPYDSYRQRERYARHRMDVQQRNSHKPGTVQPWHIFGTSVECGTNEHN